MSKSLRSSIQKRSLSKYLLLILSSFWAFSSSLPVGIKEKRYLVLFDASGSMSEPIGETTRLAAAKQKVQEFLHQLDDEASVGLVSFGNKVAGCNSARILHPIQKGSAPIVANKVSSLVASGSTPIAQSLSLIQEYLLTDKTPTEILFFSDGIESCEGDPKDILYRMRTQGKNFHLQVLGIQLDPRSEEVLKRLALVGNGRYFPIRTERDFDLAFSELRIPFGGSSNEERPMVSNIKIEEILPFEDEFGKGFSLQYSYQTNEIVPLAIQFSVFPSEEKWRSFPLPPGRERRMGDLSQHHVIFPRAPEGKGQWILRLPDARKRKVSAELWDLKKVPRNIGYSGEKSLPD